MKLAKQVSRDVEQNLKCRWNHHQPQKRILPGLRPKLSRIGFPFFFFFFRSPPFFSLLFTLGIDEVPRACMHFCIVTLAKTCFWPNLNQSIPSPGRAGPITTRATTAAFDAMAKYYPSTGALFLLEGSTGPKGASIARSPNGGGCVPARVAGPSPSHEAVLRTNHRSDRVTARHPPARGWEGERTGGPTRLGPVQEMIGRAKNGPIGRLLLAHWSSPSLLRNPSRSLHDPLATGATQTVLGVVFVVSES